MPELGNEICCLQCDPLRQHERRGSGSLQHFKIPAFAVTGAEKYLQVLDLASELRQEGRRVASQNEFRCESTQSFHATNATEHP